ncbi:hypothetical protein EDB80DRAFT_784052 [Ilyonectria destructans]|nr:hypothetical protein EDB80DRAFT_836461 [Ilyonectria destructans]KAH6975656.1 hypothetical protein EDB80DRAFT_784052 [Ilyonectria destructans]
MLVASEWLEVVILVFVEADVDADYSTETNSLGHHKTSNGRPTVHGAADGSRGMQKNGCADTQAGPSPHPRPKGGHAGPNKADGVPSKPVSCRSPVYMLKRKGRVEQPAAAVALAAVASNRVRLGR